MTIFLKCYSACTTQDETTLYTASIFYIQIALATILDFLLTVYLGIVFNVVLIFSVKFSVGRKWNNEGLYCN